MEQFLKENDFSILENHDHFYLCHKKRFSMNNQMPFFMVNDLWALEIDIPLSEFVLTNPKFENY